MQVFLSHCLEDKPTVARIGLELLRANSEIVLWIDNTRQSGVDTLRYAYGPFRKSGRVKEINVGEDWWDAVHRGLAGSGCVLGFWSLKALERRRDVFERELGVGFKNNRLVQVRLDNCQDLISAPYRYEHAADLSQGNAERYGVEFEGLMSAIGEACAGRATKANVRDMRLRRLDDDNFVSRLVDRRSFDRICERSLKEWFAGERQSPHFLLVTAHADDRPEWLTERVECWIWSTSLGRREAWKPIEVGWLAPEAHDISQSVRQHFEEWRMHASLVKLDKRVGEGRWPSAFACTLPAAGWTSQDTNHLVHAARLWSRADHQQAPEAALVLLVAISRRPRGGFDAQERAGLAQFEEAARKLNQTLGEGASTLLALEQIDLDDALNLVTLIRNAGRHDIHSDKLRVQLGKRFPTGRKLTMAAAARRVAQALLASKPRKEWWSR